MYAGALRECNVQDQRVDVLVRQTLSASKYLSIMGGIDGLATDIPVTAANLKALFVYPTLARDSRGQRHCLAVPRNTDYHVDPLLIPVSNPGAPFELLKTLGRVF